MGQGRSRQQARLRRASSREIVGKLGGLHILVNNAGIIRRADAIDFTEADWDAVLDVNLKAVFFLSQAAARHMIPHGGGKIINIASMLSFQGGIRVPSYTASKSGIAGLTRLLANEWAAQGINVNAIAPGLFRDQQHRGAAGRREAQCGDPRRAFPPAAGATRRTSAVPRCSSPRARPTTCTASILPVDGGWLAR